MKTCAMLSTYIFLYSIYIFKKNKNEYSSFGLFLVVSKCIIKQPSNTLHNHRVCPQLNTNIIEIILEVELPMTKSMAIKSL